MKCTLARAGLSLDSLYQNAGAFIAGGSLRIYSGGAPANATVAPTGTLLASCLQLGAYAASATGSGSPVMTMTPAGGICFQAASAAAGGIVGYFRVYDSAGNAVMQGSAGTAGTELILNAGTIVAGQLVTITSYVSSLSGIY